MHLTLAPGRIPEKKERVVLIKRLEEDGISISSRSQVIIVLHATVVWLAESLMTGSGTIPDELGKTCSALRMSEGPQGCQEFK